MKCISWSSIGLILSTPLCLTATQSTAFAAEAVITRVAQFKFYNPQAYNHCEETAMGEGFGQIRFEGLPRSLIRVLPAGRNLDYKAMMGGKLQAIKVLALREPENRNLPVVFSRKFTATGFYGTDELSGKRVFRVLNLKD